MTQLNDWFNNTWDLASGTEANLTTLLSSLSTRVSTFEINMLILLNMLGTKISDFETDITSMLNAQDVFMAQIDANLTALDATVDNYYSNLIAEHAVRCGVKHLKYHISH